MSRFDHTLLARALEYVGRPRFIDVPVIGAASPEDIAAELCRRFEGFRSHPYLCPAGVPTIGYGATYYLDGGSVKLTNPPISRATAERLLLMMITREYLPKVLKLCPRLVHESAGRIAAIIDFTFNLGVGRLSASTLRKRINAELWEDVPAELRKWVIGGGIVLRGLVLRRDAECVLI